MGNRNRLIREKFRTIQGDYTVAVKGTVGVNLDVTPTQDLIVFEMIINAPLADSDATLKIYNDSVATGNLKFDGYMGNRDSSNSIKFPAGITCTAKFIVVVTGGSGDLFVLARYN